MKAPLIYFLSILTISLVFSCEDRNNNLLGSIEFVSLAQGILSGNGDEGIEQSGVVITSQSELESLAEQMNAVNNTFTPPMIDFESTMVVGVFLEVKHNDHEVEIVEVRETEQLIIVSVEDTPLHSRVFTQPFHLVEIPRTDKDVFFE